MLTRDGIYAGILVDLAFERIEEARLLMRNGHHAGAAYVVGYGVELLLKAIIAGQRGGGRWPVETVATELKTHDLEVLLREARLYEHLAKASKANKELGINWITARRWGPYLRYMRLSRAEARDMVDAVAEQPDGVAEWLSFWVPYRSGVL